MSKGKIKFLIFSTLGIFLFLVPLPYNGTFTIPAGILIDIIKSGIYEYTLLPLIILIVINVLLTIITKFFKPKIIMNNEWLENTFNVTNLYFTSRIVGMIIAIMFYFQIGPDFIIADITAGIMFDLVRNLISVLIVISFSMPFLTEFGIMEFLGILLSKVVRPLFLVPGRAAIDLVTSWMGASNAAVLLTRQQYDKGFYSGKEAAIIMTNFSFVSVPFAFIVAEILKVNEYFAQFYLISLITGMIIAIIMPRIYPLSKVSDDYNIKTGKQVNENVPDNMSRLEFAISSASKKAARVTFKDVIAQGLDMFSSVILGLAPIIIAWGTFSLILVELTPIFNTISYPMGLFLQILGIPEAIQAAPATLTGFADMFIPPIMLASISSEKTRFIVGTATLLQLIYMTEVGAIILQSNVPLKFKDLLIIFLERTILALLIVTGLTTLIMNF